MRKYISRIAVISMAATINLVVPLQVVYATDLYELVALEAESRAQDSFGDECKVFVQDVLSDVSVTLGAGYRDAYLDAGYWITSDQADRGDLIQLTDPDDHETPATGSLHTAIITGRISGTTYSVVDSNWDLDDLVDHRNYDPVADAAGRANSNAYFYRLNNSGRTKSFLEASSSASSNGASNTTSDASTTGLAINPDTGTPFVSWMSGDTTPSNTERYEGDKWMSVGTNGDQGGYLAFDSNSVLYKVWYGVPGGASGNDNEIYVQKLVSGAWTDVGTNSGSAGGISNNAGESYSARLAFDSNDVPYVTWHDNSSGSDYEIYVRKYDSGTSSWVEVGSGSASGGGLLSNDPYESFLAKIVFLNNEPVIFWGNYASAGTTQRVIYAKKYSGGSWVELSSGSASGLGITGNNKSAINHGSVAVGSNGVIYLSWSHLVSQGVDENIHMKKYDTTNGWTEVGSGSSSGNGLISNSGTTWEASVALDSNNLPYIVWAETNSGNFEIYAKKFDGSSWSAVASGSGSGTGVSNTASASKVPMIAMGKDGNPILAWMETVSGIAQIYVKSLR